DRPPARVRTALPPASAARPSRGSGGWDVDWHSLTRSASRLPDSRLCGPERIVMPLDERKLEVLRAIVQDYVSTHEPVGSKMLAERHHLKVSPATIRNDMAALEDEGF